MPFNSVELASYVVLYAGSIWLLDAIFKDVDRRREGEAAKLEFEDESTSQLRKQMLLAKYSKQIVEAPAYKFSDAARAQEKNSKPSFKSQLVIYVASAIFALLILAVIHFGK